MEITLLETTGKDSEGDSTPIRFSTKGYDGTGAPGYYKGRIMSVKAIERTLAAAQRSFGNSQVAEGQIELAAGDGKIDDILDYGYGQPAELLVGAWAGAYSTFETVLKGTIEQPRYDLDTITYLFRDRQAELENLFSPARFAGDNDGVTGYEGEANTIKGQHKNRLVGVAVLELPVLVNKALQIYAVNHDRDGALAAVYGFDAVEVDGVGWDFGTDHADLATLAAATPAQGYYDTCKAKGAFKMGGTFDGEVRFSARQFEDNLPGTLMQWVLEDHGVPSGSIDSDAFDDLDTDLPYDTGVYTTGNETTQAVLDALANRVGAWVWPNRLDVYTCKALTAPEDDDSVATLMFFTQGSDPALNEFNIIKLEAIDSRDPGHGVPAWRVRAKDSPLVYENSDVLDQYPPVEIEFDLWMESDSHLQTRLNQLGAIYEKQRRMFRVWVALSPAFVQQLDIGDVVTLKMDRFGYDSGVKSRVLGLQPELSRNKSVVKMTIWV